jgi:hypothetical protein
MLFLVYRSHGEKHPSGAALHKKTLNLYSHEIFGIIESKMDEMIIILESLSMLAIENDKDGNPKILILKEIDRIRSLFIFYNTEKHLTEDKKLKISTKCQVFLENIWKKIQSQPNTEAAMTLVPIGDLLNYWKEKKMFITVEHLDDARIHGIIGEAIISADGNSLSVEVNYLKLKKLLPNIQFMNRVVESNKQKSTMA